MQLKPSNLRKIKRSVEEVTEQKKIDKLLAELPEDIPLSEIAATITQNIDNTASSSGKQMLKQVRDVMRVDSIAKSYGIEDPQDFRDDMTDQERTDWFKGLTAVEQSIELQRLLKKPDEVISWKYYQKAKKMLIENLRASKGLESVILFLEDGERLAEQEKLTSEEEFRNMTEEEKETRLQRILYDYACS